MNRWYPIGYLIIIFTCFVQADHQRIEQYFVLVENMKKYIFMIEHHVDSNYQYLDLYHSYDHAVMGTKNISEFICTCIVTSNVSSKAGMLVKGNAYLQLALVTYTLLQDFVRIWHDQKAMNNQKRQMSYQEMVIQYPFLLLIEQQINIMRHLIDMCCNGSLPEKIFAKIKLVSIVLPGPYRRSTKKWAKKLYKHAFDQQGRLIDAGGFEHQHSYSRFSEKITSDWRVLLMNAHKMPTALVISHDSAYAAMVDNDDNRILLEIIDAGMQGDFARVMKLSENNFNLLAQDLYSFYSSRIGA